MGAPPLTLGVVAAVGQLLLTLVFWAMLAADHSGHVSILDDEYRANGFCRATEASHGFDSYQLCFAVDMLGCLALVALWRQRGSRGSATLGPAASIFFHGIFHMSQYAFGWPLPSNVAMAVYPFFTLAFVGGFGVGTRVGTPLHTVLVTTAILLFWWAFVPTPFAFAYANTWIYAVGTGVGAIEGIASKAGTKPPPSPSPFLFFGVIEPFIEATLCNVGFKGMGGHAVFDATIVCANVLGALREPAAGGGVAAATATAAAVGTKKLR